MLGIMGKNVMVTVLAVHISISNCQVTKDQMSLDYNIEPVYTGHISLYQPLFAEKGDQCRQVPLYMHCMIYYVQYTIIEYTYGNPQIQAF